MEMQMIWGWQPALYLFLGGMGAGAFLTATILYFVDKTTNPRLLASAMWAALASLAVGLLLLLSELITPLRGLAMWQSFSHFTSWMTIGAWLAFFAMVFFFLSALMATDATGRRLEKIGFIGRHKQDIFQILLVLGSILALGVAVYTGMLLMSAPGVPLWNTMLLPCLFTVSALDTGVALVELISLAGPCRIEPKVQVFLERTIVAIVALEAVVAALFLVASFNGGTAAAFSASSLTTGTFAVAFWLLFAVMGLGLPFVAALLGLAKARKGVSLNGGGEAIQAEEGKVSIAIVALVGATGALVGGCALRFLVLYAGAHGDLIGYTLSVLPF